MSAPRPTTMLAAQYQPGKKELVIRTDYPVPKPGEGEVLLRVAACGVCHSDIGFIDGGVLPTPLVLGHEISGYVVEAGPGVDPALVTPDALYTVLAITPAARSLNGLPALFDSPGAATDGGFAQFATVRADQLVPAPKGVSPVLAAVAADAGINAHKFVIRSGQVTSTDKVLVIGVGGLGHQAVQLAAHLGATVYACDPKPDARALALRMGAKEAFAPDELAKKVEVGFTVDVAMDYVARATTFEAAKSALRGNAKRFPANPRLVVAGMTPENLSFNTLDTLTYNLTIATPQYGARGELAAVLDLLAAGALTPEVSAHPLREINGVLAELRRGGVLGRRVMIPPGAE